MTKSQKRELTMIIIGAVLLAAAVAVTHIFSEIPRWSKLLIFAVPYIVLGLNVILDAVHGLAGKQFLDEKFLMSVASVGALAVGEYAEAVLVMLLYRLGELLQSHRRSNENPEGSPCCRREHRFRDIPYTICSIHSAAP